MMQYTPQQIRKALKAVQRKNTKQMASSTLHTSVWMAHCRLAGEPDDNPTRALQLKTLIDWMLGQLAPDAAAASESQLAHQTLLRARFIEGISPTDLIQQRQIGRSTLYAQIDRALKACANLLNAPPDDEAQRAACHTVRASVRYQHAPPAVQTLLQQLAIYQTTIDPQHLLHVADKTIEVAKQRGWVVGEQTVALNAQLRAFVRGTFSAENRQHWYTHAAKIAEAQGEIWQAHHYLFESGQWSKSAELLLAHEAQLLRFASLNQLLNTIDAYKPANLAPSKWTRLKLLAARYASRAQGQQLALDHLQAANPSHPAFEAYTELYLAIVNREGNRETALRHFDTCLAKANLSRGRLRLPLLIEAYVRRAWLYLSDPVELKSAENDLACANELCTTIEPDPHLLILLHNVQGRFHLRAEQYTRAFESYEAGLQLANQIDHVQLKIPLTHNLGALQTRTKRDSLNYLLAGRQLAAEVGDQSSLAHFEKIIGGYYFHQGVFGKSAEYNLRAYQLFSKIGNQHALAYTCYDLAEVLLKQMQVDTAKPYFERAQQLAHTHNLSTLATLCQQLGATYPELKFNLNTRQLTILRLVRQHQPVRAKQLREAVSASASSFQRDINRLIACQLVVRVGKGAATMYQTPNRRD